MIKKYVPKKPMMSHWFMRTNAKNDKNTMVLFNRFVKLLDSDVQYFQCIPNNGVGHTVKWIMDHKVTSWSELLLAVMRLAQNVGNGWLLTGDVTSHCSAWCNRPRVAGVQSIEWTIVKTSTD
jgi:hypothetical protein